MVKRIARTAAVGSLPCRALAAWVLGLCLVGIGAVEGSELRLTPIVKAVQTARPSVVNIRGEKTLTSDAGTVGQHASGRRVNGMGTGVVIDERGYIITNHHVIDGVRDIQVTLAAGDRHTARLIARDPKTDLAIIKIDVPQALPVITMGTAKDLMPGEPVVAVGNAYGYEHTVTRGIISALGRAVQVSEAQEYENLIQTDASINPGNSGGPLLNIDGEMIGLNVAVRAGAQGIGFAIPVDEVLAVAAEMMAGCHAQAVRLGLRVSLPESGAGGVLVQSVEGDSAAAAAGLQSGDVITSIDSRAVQRPLDYHRALVGHRGGDELEVLVRRGEETRTLTLTLGDAASDRSPHGQLAWDLLGLELKPIPDADFRQLSTRYRGGLKVMAVQAGGVAAKQGVARGDVLVGMHIWETISLENVAYILTHPEFSTFDPVKFYIIRGRETRYGFFPVTVSMASAHKTQ